MTPTEPGWYWARWLGEPRAVVEVIVHGDGEAAAYRTGIPGGFPLDDFTDWHGPLVPPDAQIVPLRDDIPKDAIMDTDFPKDGITCNWV
jgi:hypothetical protein